METKTQGIEKLVKENFCKLNSIVNCGYSQESWCEKTCSYWKRVYDKAKYWNR